MNLESVTARGHRAGGETGPYTHPVTQGPPFSYAHAEMCSFFSSKIKNTKNILIYSEFRGAAPLGDGSLWMALLNGI